VTKANLHVEPDARKGKFAGKRKANFIISRPIAKMFDRIPNQERSEGRNNLIFSTNGSAISKAGSFMFGSGNL
jgi:hypothetical protein